MSKRKSAPTKVDLPVEAKVTVKPGTVTIVNRLFQSVSFTILDANGEQHGVSIQAKGSLEWSRCKFGFDVQRLCRNGSLVIR